MLLAGLRARDRIPERMDDPGLDPAEHRRALAGLARLNRFSGSAGVLWPAIAKLAARLRRTVTVLDVATGSGDVPRQLLARAQAAGVSLDVAGCDVSPTAVEEAARSSSGVRFFAHDALRDALPTGFDVVTCSLFLHHLGEGGSGRAPRQHGARRRVADPGERSRPLAVQLLRRLVRVPRADALAGGLVRRPGVGALRVHPGRGARASRTRRPPRRDRAREVPVALPAVVEPPGRKLEARNPKSEMNTGPRQTFSLRISCFEFRVYPRKMRW